MFQLLDDFSEIIYISDPETHDLLFLNKAAKVFYNVKDSSPKKCYAALHHRDSPCPTCSTPHLKFDSVYEWELTDPQTEKHYLLRNKLLHLEDNKVARMEIAVDISSQKQKIQELKGKETLDKFIINCVKILHTKQSVEKNIMDLLRETGLFLQANRAYIFLFDYEKETMNNDYEWCSENVEPQKEFLQNLPLSIIPNWLEAFHRNESFYIEDTNLLDKDTEEYKTLEPQNIKSLVAGPLMAENGELLGFIGVDDPSTKKSSQYITTLFNSFSFFIVSILEQQKIRRQLVHQSFTDSLTGLQNRNKYIKDIEQLNIDMEAKKINSIGIAFADMNDLKLLNDNFGHEKGDSALKELADTLSSSFRKQDAYRIGGDEFVILCPNIPQDMFNQKVTFLMELSKSNKIQSFSLGYKWFGQFTDINLMLKEVDSLMYKEKTKYHNRGNGCNCY